MNHGSVTSARNVIGLTWVFTFVACVLTLVFLLGKNSIGGERFGDGLGALVGVQGPGLGTIVGFYLARKGSHARQTTRMPFYLAFGIALAWNLCVLALFFVLVKGYLNVEDSIEYLGRLAKYISFLPVGLISYYFGSEECT